MISVSLLLNLIAIHCEIHSGKAPGAFLPSLPPSLPIPEALNPHTPRPGLRLGYAKPLLTLRQTETIFY